MGKQKWGWNFERSRLEEGRLRAICKLMWFPRAVALKCNSRRTESVMGSVKQLLKNNNMSPRNVCFPRYECQADTIDYIWGHFSEKSFSRKSSFGVGINQMPDNRLAHNSTLSHAEPKVNLYLSKSFVGTQRCLLSITRKGNEGMRNNLGCSYFSGEPWDDAAGEKEWEMENGNRARTFLSPFRQ